MDTEATEERKQNARSILDASPAVERNDYGQYEPRCVIDGCRLLRMEDCRGEAFDSTREAMARADAALGALKKRALEFLGEGV